MGGSMKRVSGRLSAAIALCGAVGTSGFIATSAWAQTSATRTSSFAYDAASGLLTQEAVEPGTPALTLTTSYVYDAFGNKTSVTISGVDIATRSSTATFDARGQFSTTNTNALNQSESFQYDARFAQPTSRTGPNGLTTTWTYDSFGRKTSEVRPDGTQTKWSYLFCAGINGGTATCVSGAAYLIQANPLAADGATQNGPIGIVYFDALDREIARDTQGFDGSTIRVSKQYDSFGRVLKQSRPYFASGGTPQWTNFTYDALGRVVTTTFPDSSTTQVAYHGLVTTDTNTKSQTRTVTKDSQGQVVSVTDAAGKTMSNAYDPFGKLIKTTDAVGNVVTATYDVRGRKVASSDPDMGAWTYAYDTANELVSQTNAKSQTSTFSYDVLGRMIQRVEPDMTSVWVYDTAANGVGKLASAGVTAGPSAGYQRSFAYDTLTRPVQATVTISSTNYTFAATYDGNSRLGSVTYPSGLVLGYTYTSLGYAQQVTGLGGQVYWTANASDAEMHLTQQTAGNGVVTSQSFDPQTGRLNAILAGAGNIVENFSYTYDVLGNVLTRADANENLTETFTYDNLNRVTSATVSQNIAPVKTFAYDAIGNLLSKSDVGNYTYPLAGSALPHAVTSISGGNINTTFTYDANGNQTSGLGRSISYTSFNKPSSITQGSGTLFFSHDIDHQRFKQTAPEGITLYFDAFGVHTELFQSSTTAWYDFIGASGSMLGVRVLHSDNSVTTRYFHTDNLGSIAVITDESGTVVERDSYDAWGKRRFPTGADDPSGSVTSQTTRGFTGQEELADVGLVHLNGRVYDPLIGRMTSADPMVPDPMNGQTWNRYSYVVNNPLALTDTNGYCFLGLCGIGHAISTFFNRTFGALFREFPILGNLLEIAAVALCVPLGGGVACMMVSAFMSTTFVGGVTTGNLGYALQAGIIAAVTAAAFYEVGTLAKSIGGEVGYALKVAGHALVGCVSAVASARKCGPAALAGGITSAIGPLITGQNFALNTTLNAVLGGLASVAGGGKFANGAVTGAFGYLFNDFSHLWLGWDAHYSIESFFENKNSNFSAEVQINVDGGRPIYADLTYWSALDKTIYVWEIKADTWYSRYLAADEAGEYVAAMQKDPQFAGWNIAVGTKDLLNLYYSPGETIFSNTVAGRWYLLNEEAGNNGDILYENHGNDPWTQALKQGLRYPWWIPTWPSDRPKYKYP
jgi:RHS repeat-associated protein